jgi:DNA mismatch endonuclease (patch repair protein)
MKMIPAKEAIERTDHVSSATRSSIMRAVKSKGARSTERRLRAVIVANGLRGWRMHADELPGKPDFVFTDSKIAIFVDGCFWHGCPKCYRRPHSSQSYWDTKVARNMARDKSRRAELRRLGWRVLRFWEHEVKASAFAAAVRIKAEVDSPAG